MNRLAHHLGDWIGNDAGELAPWPDDPDYRQPKKGNSPVKPGKPPF